MARVSMIAAIGRNRELGKGNELLWRIPDDLKRFKQLTLGHPIVMGRKTFESILAAIGKPLPGRTNIVVTREGYPFRDEKGFHFWSAQIEKEGYIKVDSIAGAIHLAKKMPGGEEIFIGGGGEIYRQALPFADKLYLTLIDDEKEADSFFPEYENEFTKMVREESREYEGLKYNWLNLEKEQPRR